MWGQLGPSSLSFIRSMVTKLRFWPKPRLWHEKVAVASLTGALPGLWPPPLPPGLAPAPSGLPRPQGLCPLTFIRSPAFSAF